MSVGRRRSVLKHLNLDRSGGQRVDPNIERLARPALVGADSLCGCPGWPWPCATGSSGGGGSQGAPPKGGGHSVGVQQLDTSYPRFLQPIYSQLSWVSFLTRLNDLLRETSSPPCPLVATLLCGLPLFCYCRSQRATEREDAIRALVAEENEKLQRSGLQWLEPRLQQSSRCGVRSSPALVTAPTLVLLISVRTEFELHNPQTSQFLAELLYRRAQRAAAKEARMVAVANAMASQQQPNPLPADKSRSGTFVSVGEGAVGAQTAPGTPSMLPSPPAKSRMTTIATTTTIAGGGGNLGFRRETMTPGSGLGALERHRSTPSCENSPRASPRQKPLGERSRLEEAQKQLVHRQATLVRSKSQVTSSEAAAHLAALQLGPTGYAAVEKGEAAQWQAITPAPPAASSSVGASPNGATVLIQGYGFNRAYTAPDLKSLTSAFPLSPYASPPPAEDTLAAPADFDLNDAPPPPQRMEP